MSNQNTNKMKKTAKIGSSLKGIFEKVTVTLFMMTFGMLTKVVAQTGQVQGQGQVSNSIADLYNNEIAPIINVVVLIAISISAVYAAFQFFQGKREGYKTVIYIIVGALLIKFLPELLMGILND